MFEVAMFEVAVFESAMLKELRAFKAAESVSETDCAAMFEVCDRVWQTGGCLWWKTGGSKSWCGERRRGKR